MIPLSDIISEFSPNELLRLEIDELINSFRDIVKLNLQKSKSEKLDFSMIEFETLSIVKQDQILQEIFFWSKQKIKEHREDFGYGINGIILRELKKQTLVGDFIKKIDDVTLKNRLKTLNDENFKKVNRLTKNQILELFRKSTKEREVLAQNRKLKT